MTTRIKNSDWSAGIGPDLPTVRANGKSQGVKPEAVRISTGKRHIIVKNAVKKRMMHTNASSLTCSLLVTSAHITALTYCCKTLFSSGKIKKCK
jgi:hypothetical protein